MALVCDPPSSPSSDEDSKKVLSSDEDSKNSELPPTAEAAMLSSSSSSAEEPALPRLPAPALLFRGTVIDSASRSELRVLRNAVLGVSADGFVAFVEGDHVERLQAGGSLTLREPAATVSLAGARIHTLPPRAFLTPGFVDTHTHAPQFSFAGLGYDLPLLEWLETYTFPAEEKFADLKYAASVCENAVRRTLTAGTTSCIYFGTIHTDAAVVLGRTASMQGQRSFIGKVNMDRNAPDSYRETTEESLAETERFVDLLVGVRPRKARKDRAAAQAAPPAKRAKLTGAFHGEDCPCCDDETMAIMAKASPTPGSVSDAPAKGPAPVPVITPRFVPTCSQALMEGLAKIADRHNLLVQSHVSENRGEVLWVKDLHPKEASYTHVYDSMGLLTERTILAHGVYLTEGERALLRDRKATVAHCPMSNSMLRSGMLNVRRLLNDDVHVSLGTDVSGGASPSMLSAIREALKISNLVCVAEGAEYSPLSYSEAFWLATVGGARSLNVPGVNGDLQPGSAFDAVIVDPDAASSPLDLYGGDGPTEAFQKWLQLGDDRNTAEVYVQGRQVYTAQRQPRWVRR